MRSRVRKASPAEQKTAIKAPRKNARGLGLVCALAKYRTLFVFVIFTALITSCTLEKPAKEKPAPIRTGIAKSFFIGEGPTIKAGQHFGKTFMCGWAAVKEAGSMGEALGSHNRNLASHCNVEFQITENELLALMVNPSFINDPTRWKKILSIPITEHYYYEKKKDEYGRETNETERNSSRSDWSARPYMNLDLTRVRAFDATTQDGAGAWNAEVMSVYDIEFDEKSGRNFFAFTADMSEPRAEGDWQTAMRFNFYEFQHKPEFKRTPYHQNNGEYINVLHILGAKDEGVDQFLYAGHWDTSKVNEIYLKNFPSEFVELGHEVIKLWNDKFELIGEGRPFIGVVNNDKMKYTFDMRYPAIYWVEDRRISENSPLGIGLATADVRNGEILWAGINIFSGAMREGINRTRENKTMMKGFSAESFDVSILPKFNHIESFNSNFFEISQLLQSKGEGLSSSLSALKDIDRANKVSLSTFLDSDLFSMFSFSSDRVPVYETNARGQPQAVPKLVNRQEYNKLNYDEAMKNQMHSGGQIFDSEMTLGNALAGQSAGDNKFLKEKSYDSLLRLYLKEVLLHEFGHILGIGHNFKGAIVPEEGSMPDQHIQAMKAKATPEKGYTQASTVMNYRFTSTTMHDNYNDIQPGPHDVYMLRYLYKQQYPIYNKVTKKSDFAVVKPDGQFYPEPTPGFKIAFYPACNDAHASFYMDPYCNRWAIGYDAHTLVQEYLSRFDEALSRHLFATPKLDGADPESFENWLMHRAFTAMSRVRGFYDYMRMKYHIQIRQIASNENMLYAFSCACKAEDNAALKRNCGEGSATNIALKRPDIEAYEKIFKENPEFKNLCQANAYAVNQFTNYIAKDGVDYTSINYDSQFMHAAQEGGDIQLSNARVDGDWDELSVFPIKFAALLNLTNPTPLAVIGGGLRPIYKYWSNNAQYSYATLYPIEFTGGVSNAIVKNIHFKGPGYESAQMGRIITHFNYFLAMMRGSKDNQNLSLPGEYWDRLYAQTRFDVNLNIVWFDGDRSTESSKKDKIYGFSGKALDPQIRTESDLEAAYLLSPSQAIVKSKDSSSILVPIFMIVPKAVAMQGDMKPHDGFALAYNVNYQNNIADPLRGHGVKKSLMDLYKAQIDSCVNDQGLAAFFTSENKKFAGFDLPENANIDDRVMRNFNWSLVQALKAYKESTGKNIKVCEEVINSVGLIGASAMILNGFFTQEIEKYVRF